jgi:hypothetical protein
MSLTCPNLFCLHQVVALLVSGLSKGGGGAKQTTGISPAGGATAAGEEKAARPKGLVAAISRSGNPAEVLRGPFIYVLVLLLSTLVYWRENVVGGKWGNGGDRVGDPCAEISVASVGQCPVGHVALGCGSC